MAASAVTNQDAGTHGCLAGVKVPGDDGRMQLTGLLRWRAYRHLVPVGATLGAILGVVLVSIAPVANADPAPSTRDAGNESVAAVTTLARGLVSPWGLDFLPDGSALVSERNTAVIKRVWPDGRVGVVGRVPQARPSGEGGLLGLAIEPGPDPRWVYAYVTTASDNRIVRMAWDGTRLGRPWPILTGIPRASIHNGGRLTFGPDGSLYAATGDAGQESLAQRPRSLAGKVLRINPDGSIPADNPIPGSAVWTVGHRNVQGLAFDGQGRLFASEFGARDVDELNLLVRGGNYGWPRFEGPAGRPGLIDPIATWSPTAVASPSGVALAHTSAWVASLRGERLWRVPLNGGVAGDPEVVNVGERGRLRTIAVAPDGSLWLMTSNTDGRGNPRPGDDRILRLTIR